MQLIYARVSSPEVNVGSAAMGKHPQIRNSLKCGRKNSAWIIRPKRKDIGIQDAFTTTDVCMYVYPH